MQLHQREELEEAASHPSEVEKPSLRDWAAFISAQSQPGLAWTHGDCGEGNTALETLPFHLALPFGVNIQYMVSLMLQRKILLPSAPTWSICSKGQISPFMYCYVFIYSGNANAALSCQNLSTLVFWDSFSSGKTSTPCG